MNDLRRPIALLGMRCSGKTSTGWVLARRLGLRFVDLDEEVLRFARHAGHEAKSAGALLEDAGRAIFRDLEGAVVKKLLEPSPRVVLATGGGVVERADSRMWLERVALCVWLSVPAAVLQERLREAAGDRPPVLGEDALAEVPVLLARREPLYRELANLVVECRGDETPETVADRILGALAPVPEATSGPAPGPTPDTAPAPAP